MNTPLRRSDFGGAEPDLSDGHRVVGLQVIADVLSREDMQGVAKPLAIYKRAPHLS